MKTITRIHVSTKHFMDDIHNVERSGIRGKNRSYAHKTDTLELTQPRVINCVSTQVSALLNRIRTESSR